LRNEMPVPLQTLLTTFDRTVPATLEAKFSILSREPVLGGGCSIICKAELREPCKYCGDILNCTDRSSTAVSTTIMGSVMLHCYFGLMKPRTYFMNSDRGSTDQRSLAKEIWGIYCLSAKLIALKDLIPDRM
jgi:hypothetical protein